MLTPHTAMDSTTNRYEILRVVNRGGMGEIALGRALGTKGFEKLVILKRLRADAERADHVQMFDVEQEVMSRIEHPNIVKVFDQPVIDGIPYLAMEYVRGRNLDQLIRQAQYQNRELELTLSLSIVAEVLRGLAFVHRLKDNDGNALGVVHQDMTPSNVMVSFFGEVKITDFGISYVTSRDGGLRRGVLKGKPRYVAPEVLAGKRVNNRADIYGVGVVFYELLTGGALFARSSVKETLGAVARNELPDFHEKFEHLGSGIPKLLERALKKDPAERYRTAEEMAADVLNELKKRSGPIPPASLGFKVRQLFKDDPDVPEMDPAFEEVVAKDDPGTKLAPLNLEETVQELDRLLGEDSTDLFQLPPELHTELADLEDADPFEAHTPLPDFVWDAKNDDEVLARADQIFGKSGQPVQRWEAKEGFHAKLEALTESDPSFDITPGSAPKPLPAVPASSVEAAPEVAPPRMPPPRRPPSDARAEETERLDRQPRETSAPQADAPPTEDVRPAPPEAEAPPEPVSAIEAQVTVPQAKPAVAEAIDPEVQALLPQSPSRFFYGLMVGLGLGVAMGYFLSKMF